jgi:hypothetical protein
MITFTAHELLLDALLIVIILVVLDRREARWALRPERHDPSRLRALRGPRPELRDAGGSGAAYAPRKAS